jgi:hypothetical protein
MLCSSQVKLRSGTPDLDHPVLAGVENTDKGGQDCTFQFRGGLLNYKAHGDLSWFRPLLGGNSPMSSGLMLKMNRCYKGMSRELEKFMW